MEKPNVYEKRDRNMKTKRIANTTMCTITYTFIRDLGVDFFAFFSAQ